MSMNVYTRLHPGLLGGLLLLLLTQASGRQTQLAPAVPEQSGEREPTVQLADQCSAKVKRMMTNANLVELPNPTVYRFSEAEVNSYLEFELRQYFHASLKSLSFDFEQQRLISIAALDFDALGLHSDSVLTALLSKIWSGVHILLIEGNLIADAGKVRLELLEAKFDQADLPRTLVKQIISAVGKNQNPPFDPMELSALPYRIRQVDVHKEYILIHQ